MGNLGKLGRIPGQVAEKPEKNFEKPENPGETRKTWENKKSWGKTKKIKVKVRENMKA